ncbi:TMPRSS15 [Mytilus coruscus]|uniref:TMPRSS15 n=1 Tax=Mytilus coruscus TaxID=42192 RepID=A0A6J8D9U5_MYTCO|nr:TMPRSS15 [Mytilus coruscus]
MILYIYIEISVRGDVLIFVTVSSISCDFEDQFLCGYRSTDVYNFMEGKKVLYQEWIYDHTYQNTSGRFYGMVSYLGSIFSFSSPVQEVTNRSCLSLYYIGHANRFDFEVRYLDSEVISSNKTRNITRFSDSKLTDVSNIWKPAQMSIEPGKIQINFQIHDVNSDIKYFGIDDVTLTPGECPPLVCPAGLLPCLKDGICIKEKIECDKIPQCPSGEDEAVSVCPISISCDFEKFYGCGYVKDNKFIWREAFVHHLPSVDHTMGPMNSTGHYMYFTSDSRQTGSLTSPLHLTTPGGCVKFYYNIEGGVSAELKVYVQKNWNRSMVFYANGIFIDRDEWLEGYFELPAGETRIEFVVYGDTTFFSPASVAIDDVVFTEGENCTKPACTETPNGFACERSGICIPEFLTRDGYQDCLDGSDEKLRIDDSKDNTNSTNQVSVCTFESTVEANCLFYNDHSGLDTYDWIRRSGSTPSTSTGPNRAMVGNYYMYIETSTMGYLSNARLVSNILNPDKRLCLSFYYHMYGISIKTLEVIVSYSGTNQTIFTRSGNQGNQWYYKKLYIQPATCTETPNGFACERSGICIPEFLTRDGYQDCLDGSDEKLRIDDSKDNTNSTNQVSVCTFESTVEANCLFYNDHSGLDTYDWIRRSGSTPSTSTGPNRAMVGNYYMYIETSTMGYLSNARLVSNILNPDKRLCLSFYYHMYGISIKTLEVIVSYSGTNQTIFTRSGNQGNQWYYKKLYIQPASNLQIVFNGIDGNGYQGDIALDHILLFSGECDNSSVPVNKSSTFSPSVRLVGGQTNATGRLELQAEQIGYFSPVCASYWDKYDTKVACRQLGYNNSRMYTKSEYGKGRSQRQRFSYKFYCDGSERNLSSCASTPVYCSSVSDVVAIDCSNTECFENEYSCGDTDVTSSCGSDQFQCSNHECVALINRCDGTPQCSDGSDEFRCVKRDDNGQISVYRDGAWTLMCYTDDQTLAEYICSITGWGPYSSYSAGISITDGFLAQPGSSPNGIITNYMLHNQTSCNALTVQCGDIECGVPSVSSTPAGSYVLYGNDAVPGEWPWQALFFMDGSSGCGATLIDPYYAITAAHCVDRWTRFQIHVGEVKESKMLGSDDKGQRISVAQVIRHPNYRGSSNSYLSDIAIVRLSQPANYNSYVRPACIATDIHQSFDNCYITGWGYKEDVNHVSSTPDHLQEVRVDINVDVERCNKSIQTLGVIVPTTGICVKNKNPYAPACNGDSGGPLVCQNKYGRWELVGVASFGKRGCRGDQIPVIYQSVPYHIDWILQNTGIQINKASAPTPPPQN